MTGIMSLVTVWQKLITDKNKSWVLFKNGTVVIFVNADGTDLKDRAIQLMKTYGVVYIGSPAGDFNVIGLRDAPGWAVTGHHKDIITYVSPDELGNTPSDLQIGFHGRTKRDNDAKQLEIIHVEENF